MASEDVASVRAEIKAWERSFYSKNERNPTVDDIRANQQIANRYKLYKKLSKAAASSLNSGTSGGSSSARPSQRPSSVISKSRALETTSALSSYNPFSPKKDKERQKSLLKTANVPPPNPFATPSKIKIKARGGEPSPSPVHETVRTQSANLPPGPLSAITRARKRLRGEPVSPSPNKDKRRRILTRTNMSRRDSSSSDNGDDSDEEAGNSSFVADSPVKGSSRKSFMSLFEDASSDNKVESALMSKRSTSAGLGLFGPIRNHSVPFEDDLESVLGPVDGKLKPRPRSTNSLLLSNKLVTRKDNLYSDSASQPSHTQVIKDNPDNNQISGKRLHPDSDSESARSRLKPSKLLTSATGLIPPSPPKDAPSQRSLDALTGKGKGKAPRKKMKFDDDEDLDSLSDDVKVLANVSRPSGASNDDYDLDAGPEFDPVFWYDRHPRISNGERANDTFEVDLPDKLKHVLALSASDITLRAIHEEKVVEGLIYGRRTIHYEPSKGGEIWDVGDVDGVGQQKDAGDGKVVDEDWEGEPVPWEVGEL
ncbi:hypothetical protein J3R30DRAFT_3282898 [Lentinula aciculospora]|uniref:DNA replication regulator SLD2 n=1 Tax=Lentinula aciculospora TaxID=153920 RepID=A0A9W9DTX5_9AGAR|nr:hypothetical protein J3R30DRAFT_3282898 [Lentinula aciculospora]